MTTKTKNWARTAGLGAGLAGVAILGIAGAFGLGSGCGGGGSCGGAISTSWDLVQDGATVGCAPGDMVDLRVDTDQMTATFDCSAGGGVTPTVEGGVTHSVSLTLYDSAGTVLSQTGDMNLFVPCGATQATPRVEFDLQ